MESDDDASDWKRLKIKDDRIARLEKAVRTLVWFLVALSIGFLLAIIFLATQAEALDAQMDVLARSLGGA